jgi:hypothetical protein
MLFSWLKTKPTPGIDPPLAAYGAGRRPGAGLGVEDTRGQDDGEMRPAVKMNADRGGCGDDRSRHVDQVAKDTTSLGVGIGLDAESAGV